MARTFEPKLLTSANAILLSERHSILRDIDHVIACCDLLMAKHMAESFGPEFEALFDSVAVRYRRCFTNNGVRKPLNSKNLKCLTVDALKRHQFVYDVANTHVGHSGSMYLTKQLPEPILMTAKQWCCYEARSHEQNL